MDFSQPAAQLLLDGDDRGGGVLPRRADALQQLQASLRRRAQSRDVVCVKNQQSLFRRFAAPDTRVRAARTRVSGAANLRKRDCWFLTQTTSRLWARLRRLAWSCWSASARRGRTPPPRSSPSRSSCAAGWLKSIA